MRGAIAVALVYYYFDPKGMADDSHRSTIIATTLIVVLFSTVVFSAATKPLLEFMLGAGRPAALHCQCRTLCNNEINNHDDNDNDNDSDNDNDNDNIDITNVFAICIYDNTQVFQPLVGIHQVCPNLTLSNNVHRHCGLCMYQCLVCFMLVGCSWGCFWGIEVDA